VELDQPGEPDDACPPVEIPDMAPLPGCCTSHGVCGTLDTFIGLGCTPPPPGVAEPIACGDGAADAGAGGSEADAGTEPTDAGGSSEPMPDDAGMSTDADAAADASP
jgi:hypothetical protein